MQKVVDRQRKIGIPGNNELEVNNYNYNYIMLARRGMCKDCHQDSKSNIKPQNRSFPDSPRKS